MKGASVRAVLAGVGVAALLGLAAGFLLWPRLIAAGVLDLQQFNHRVLYILAGALPAMLGGYIAGRMAPDRPVAHGIAVGLLLLIPLLVGLPAVIRAYREVPQSPLPILLAWVMRPAAGAAGAYLTGRGETTQPS
jgi:hypothetical protein